MSRNHNPTDRKCHAETESVRAEETTDIVEQALVLYGSDAPAAVAFCGLDAWFEGRDDELQRWADIYKRLGN